MDIRGLILLAVIGSSAQFECPKYVNDCFNGNLPSYDGNVDLLCTTILAKTLDAIGCLRRCKVPALPNHLTNAWALINSTCTVKTGCSDISTQFFKYERCFDGMGGAEGVCGQVISDFNSNKLFDTSCQFLRSGRYCQSTAVGNCAYLVTILNQQQDETPKCRTAISVCGSENVPEPAPKSICSENIFTLIEQKCGVSCFIADADSPESLCQALQRQSDCLVEESGSCSGSLETYLLPRMDSYAMVNDFLNCNISIDGIVVKPFSTIGREDCDYRRVLQNCLMVTPLDAIHYIFMKNLLNLDFPLDAFCKADLNVKSQMELCTSSLWSCSLPVGQTYKTPSKFDGSFFPALGAFPLNRWGLQAIVDSCPYSPVKSTALCRGSTLGPARQTPAPHKRRTPPSIFRRPTPSRKPILL